MEEKKGSLLTQIRDAQKQALTLRSTINVNNIPQKITVSCDCHAALDEVQDFL
jgi:hypothetical protein